MANNGFSFDEDDLDFDDELPEFGADDTMTADPSEDKPLPGMTREDIVGALEQEFGVVAEEDKTRDELAEELIETRKRDDQEEAMQNLTDQSQELGMGYGSDDPDVDWVDEETGDFEDDDGFPDVEEDDETDDESLPAGLQHALKQQGIEPQTLSVEKAIGYVKEFAEGVSKHQEQVMLLRWQQGLIAAATPVQYGQSTMQKLSEATGVHPNTLRECKRLVEEFNYRVTQFKDWIREPQDGIRRWYEVQDLIKDTTPTPDDTDDQKKRKHEKLIKEVERLAHRLEKVNGIIEQADDVDDDTQAEIDGLTKAAMAEIRRFMKTRFFQTGDWDGDQPIPRSETYLNFVKEHCDPINGKPAHDPSHGDGKKGTGIKSSDFSAAPLTRTHHNELHQHGRKWFEDQYGVSLDKIEKNMMHKFLTGQTLDMEIKEHNQ